MISKKRSIITFLYSNDVHGNISSFNVLEELMEDCDENNTIVVDAGDTFSEEYQGKLVQLCLRDIVDIWLPGNHDFLYYPQNIKNLIECKRPIVLCSNLKDNEDKIKSQIIVEISGYRFLFLGLSAYVETDDFIYKDIGIAYSDIIGKYGYKVDFVVLVSHLGMNEDIRIARNTEEVDIIIGGHSHSEIKNPFVINHTIIAQAGGFGKYAGKLQLYIKSGKIERFTNKLYPSNEYTINAKMYNRIKKVRNDKEVLFFLEKDMYYEKYSENPVIEGFLNNVLLYGQSDGVMVNSSVFKTGFYKGELNSEDLLGFFNYPVEFYVVYLTKDEIEKILRKSKKEDYLKINFRPIDRCFLDNEKYKIVISDFLAQGGHYGGSLYPELKEKDKVLIKLDKLRIMIDVFKGLKF
jgi:2',3'-cyclic-nucleotide 2'-phosphodiesterase (5'-nucleotidase family)